MGGLALSKSSIVPTRVMRVSRPQAASPSQSRSIRKRRSSRLLPSISNATTSTNAWSSLPEAASRSSTARATSPGCGAKRGFATPTATSSSSTRRAKLGASRRGEWKTRVFHRLVAAQRSLDRRLRRGAKVDSMPRRCSFKLELDFPQPLAGVDEAGCAPLAGPVVAAACILDRDKFPRGIDDSKNLPLEKREALYARADEIGRPGASESQASRRSTGSTSIGRGCWR